MDSSTVETAIALAGLILGFGFVIFVHELGHFLVAKAVGIKVTQFAIGFGPSIFSWRKGVGMRLGSTEPEYNRRVDKAVQGRLPRAGDPPADDADAPRATADIAQRDAAAAELGLGETEYRLNWLPLGGYVKMLGQEDLDPTATSADPRSFNRKPVWARACVISAGVVMNLIFALIFLIVAFKAGVALPPAVVGYVADESPAAKATPVEHKDDPAFAGLQAGDRIVAIDGDPADDFTEVLVKSALSSPDARLRITVERTVEGEPTELTYVISPESGPQGLRWIGISQPVSTVIADGARLPDSIKAQGVKPGMKVMQAGPYELGRYDHHLFAQAFDESAGEPVRVVLEGSQGARVEAMLEPAAQLQFDEKTERTHLMGMVPVAMIAAVQEGSPAAKMGMKTGDVIRKINGENWPSVKEVIDAVRNSDGKPVQMQVLREGETVDLTPMPARLQTIGDEKAYALGFSPAADVRGEPIIAATFKGSPLHDPALLRGARLTEINGQSVATWADVQRQLMQFARNNPEGGTVTISYTEPLVGKPTPGRREVTIDADTAGALTKAGWDAPIQPQQFEELRDRVSRDEFGDAAAIGFEKTHQFMLQTYITLARLAQGTVKPSHLRGPVGIVDEGTKIAKLGWPYLLFFLGIISVNLVVINFLPIPIVDGGLMVFLIVEKIKGSPVGPRVLTAANLVGLALIACVFLTVTYFDVMRIFGI